jgi:hypothetical protein
MHAVKWLQQGHAAYHGRNVLLHYQNSDIIINKEIFIQFNSIQFNSIYSVPSDPLQVQENYWI